MEEEKRCARYKFRACEIASCYQSTSQLTNEYPTKERKEEGRRNPENAK
jgi:hypothetical protein